MTKSSSLLAALSRLFCLAPLRTSFELSVDSHANSRVNSKVVVSEGDPDWSGHYGK